MEKELNKLNEEYISLIKDMRKINTWRREVYEKFQELNPSPVETKIMRTPSIHHDLFGNDLDNN